MKTLVTKASGWSEKHQCRWREGHLKDRFLVVFQPFVHVPWRKIYSSLLQLKISLYIAIKTFIVYVKKLFPFVLGQCCSWVGSCWVELKFWLQGHGLMRPLGTTLRSHSMHQEAPWWFFCFKKKIVCTNFGAQEGSNWMCFGHCWSVFFGSVRPCGFRGSWQSEALNPALTDYSN